MMSCAGGKVETSGKVLDRESRKQRQSRDTSPYLPSVIGQLEIGTGLLIVVEREGRQARKD